MGTQKGKGYEIPNVGHVLETAKTTVGARDKDHKFQVNATDLYKANAQHATPRKTNSEIRVPRRTGQAGYYYPPAAAAAVPNPSTNQQEYPPYATPANYYGYAPSLEYPVIGQSHLLQSASNSSSSIVSGSQMSQTSYFPSSSITTLKSSDSSFHGDPYSYQAAQPVDESDLIKTAHHEPHVILTRKFYLLLVVIIVMLVAGMGCVIWGIHESTFGTPPTLFSQQAYFNTLYALGMLFLVSLLSTVVLRCKVHHMGIGYFVMFIYVVTLYFALKGCSRASVSLKYDDIVTIEKYIFRKGTRTEGELPPFFHRIQTNFKCCGTTEIDKMKDWPSRLQTTDMPESCCKRQTPTCGLQLARTHTYTGIAGGSNRMASGFFLILTDKEMEGIVQTGKPVKIVRAPNRDGVDLLLHILTEYYVNSLKSGYPPETPVSEMKRTPNDMIQPYNISEGSIPETLGCRNDTLLEKVTTIGWQIQLALDRETTKLHWSTDPIAYDWTAWKIPVCNEFRGRKPYHLAANLNRGSDVKHMWYISRGITENYILKDVLWEKYCETKENLQAIQIPIPQQHRNAYQAVGIFYIAFVNQLMYACLGISVTVLALLLIVFLVFWKYYTRMKLEEYANLPYPPEFDNLKVRQSDLYITHGKEEHEKKKSGPVPDKMKVTKRDVTSGSSLVVSDPNSFTQLEDSSYFTDFRVDI